MLSAVNRTHAPGPVLFLRSRIFASSLIILSLTTFLSSLPLLLFLLLIPPSFFSIYCIYSFQLLDILFFLLFLSPITRSSALFRA